MPKTDLILLHAPSVYDFRRKPVMYGPISDVVPSSQIFEMYPIGFMSLRGYLQKHGYSVRIINIALLMLHSRRFDAEKLIRSLHPMAFGIDLHWLVHAQGSLELARIVKKYHPDIPVIFGGLSSSFYHEELIRYPQVDFVLRGDSAEEPLRRLIEVVSGKQAPDTVPNLTWKKNGNVIVNDYSHVPADLDGVSFDYRTMMSSSALHLDLLGHLPFKGWLRYPIVAAMFCRGCVNDCVTCGGSSSAFRNFCARSSPAFRSPQLVAEDIGLIARYFNSPIILLGDIRQAGDEYAHTLLDHLKQLRVRNHIAFELFRPPPKEFLAAIAEAVPNFNIQVSPESHDESIRKAFGKKYDNASLERAIEQAFDVGCRRVDVFFMIGLPFQTPGSVRETVAYCGDLMARYGGGKSCRVQPYIAPLAPFLDPGSHVFNEPGKYGYTLIHKTLEEHRQALLSPSWKHALNYETEWMSRDEIVSSTYAAAAELNRLKLEHGLLSRREAAKIERRIELEKHIADEIDVLVGDDSAAARRPAGDDGTQQEEAARRIMHKYDFFGHTTICKKSEMNWPATFFGFRALRIVRGTLAEMLEKVSLK